jgi:tetratricopeptide (TPR) repeat protein
MKKCLSAFGLSLLWATCAWAHGDISTLPNSVQIMQYRLLLYIDPDDPKPRNALAMALFRTNELTEAQKELRYILDRDPANFDALDGLGIVLTKMEDYQEALECLTKAVELNGEDVMVHVHLSVLLERMKQPESARHELEKARSLASSPGQGDEIDRELKLIGSF